MFNWKEIAEWDYNNKFAEFTFIDKSGSIERVSLENMANLYIKWQQTVDWKQ